MATEELGGRVVLPAVEPPVGVLLGVCPGDGLAVPVGLGVVLGSVNVSPAGPAKLDASLLVSPSVNGSLTMLAAAKPTLTEATAKTAHRATSATLLGTANLRMSGLVCRVCGMGP